MSSKSTITVTVGVSGSGKTYYRCAVFLVDEWLPNHEGLHISNFPVNIENLKRDFPNYDIDKRIELIPKDVLKEWREGTSGPWDYFANRDLSGAHIAIDEIHNYCGKATSNAVKKKWLQFIGELRHQGATMEFLTQSEAKCAKEILNEAEIRYEIINGENKYMPILGYRMGDLYEFRAKLLGRYLCPSFFVEYIQAKGKWTPLKEQIFYRLPKYFEYYDSYSAPEHGKASGNKAEKRPWEKYNWFWLFVWFYLQYPIRINVHILALGLFIWFFFCGGMSQSMHKYFEIVSGAAGIAFNGNKNEKVKKTIEEPKTNQNPDDQKQIIVDGSDVVNEKGEKIGKWVVKRKMPRVAFATTKYLRFREGGRLRVGDQWFGRKIIIIDIDRKELVLEDLSIVPFSSLEN